MAHKDADAWLELLRKCQQLPEADVMALCAKVGNGKRTEGREEEQKECVMKKKKNTAP